MISLKVTDNFTILFDSDSDFKKYLKSRNKIIYLIPTHEKSSTKKVFRYTKVCAYLLVSWQV